MNSTAIHSEEDRSLRLRQIVSDSHSADPEKAERAREQYLYEIKGYLIETVKKYAGFLVNDQDDLLHECFITALKKLPDYDPDKGALTTYLKRDLLHTISLYIADNSYHTTAYYGELASKVNRASASLQVLDIEPSAANIALKADLTLSQAEIGLSIINASSEHYYESYTHGEDLIRKTAGTPEEEYLKAEGLERWYSAFKELPSQAVLMFLLYYGITEEETRCSYAMLSRRFHISPRQAALEIDSVRRSLRNNRDLQDYYNKKNPAVIRDSIDTLISTIPMECGSFYEQAYRFIREDDKSVENAQTSGSKNEKESADEQVLTVDFSVLMQPLQSLASVFGPF